MAELLAVDLEILSDQALGDFKRKLSTIDEVKIGKGLTADLKAEITNVDKSAQDLQGSLKAMAAAEYQGKGLKWIRDGSIAAKKEILDLRQKIKELDKAGAGANKLSILNTYEADAKALQRELDKATRKLDYLNKLQPANKGIVTGADPKAITGNPVFQNVASGVANAAGVPVEVEQAVLIGSELAGLSTAALATFGAIAAAGYGIIKVSEKIRSEAEKRLKIEEMIAGAANKQILAGKEIIANLEKARSIAADDRQFGASLQSSTIDELEKRRDLLKKFVDLNPLGENASRYGQQILALDAQIEASRQKNSDQESKSFDERWQRYLKEQDLQKQNALEQQKALISISEKAATTRDALKEALISSSDNPLVKLMADIESATEKTEKKLKDLKNVLDPAEFTKLVENVAAVERSAAQAIYNKAVFDNSSKALDLNYQAQREAAAFTGIDRQRAKDEQSRLLNLVDLKSEFASQSLKDTRAAAEAQYFAKEFNPNDPKTFDQSKFGNLSEFLSSSSQILDEIKALQNIDLSGTGISGKGLVAEKINQAITISNDDLIKAISAGGAERYNAQTLLDLRAGSLADLKAANRQKFEDVLAQDKFNQETKAEALMLANEFIFDKSKLINGSGLADLQKSQEFINLTDQFDPADLSPQIRQARLQALNLASQETRAEAKQAGDSLKMISGVITEINDQLKAKVLKGFENAVRIIDETGGKIRIDKLPTQSDTERAYQQ